MDLPAQDPPDRPCSWPSIRLLSFVLLPLNYRRLPNPNTANQSWCLQALVASFALEAGASLYATEEKQDRDARRCARRSYREVSLSSSLYDATQRTGHMC